MKTALLGLFSLLIVVGCGASTPTKSVSEDTSIDSTEANTQVTQGASWWKNAVFYQVFIRSFADSTRGAVANDGIGDLNGLIEKLDYLNDGDDAAGDDLGVSAVWLSPVMPSAIPSGYAPTGEIGIDASLGDLDAAKQLLNSAHQRGMKVVVDFALNQVSSEHPKFKAALNGDDEAKDWFVFRQRKPKDLYAYGRQVWHKSEAGYYYGFFGEETPDLNFRSKAVRAMLEEQTRFLINELGVDGIGIDAAQYLVEEGSNVSDTNSNLAFLEYYQQFVKSLGAQVLTIADVSADINTSAKYQASHADLTFLIELSKHMVTAANIGKGKKLKTALRTLQAKYPNNRGALLLSNHDTVRSMTILNQPARAKLAASLLFTLPGVPFMYYGEEIGMTGRLPEEFVRTPMRWNSNDPNMGFSTATPWTPLNDDFDYVNVANQIGNSQSLYSWYQTLIALRNNNAALNSGKFEWVESDDENIIAFKRSAEDQNLLVVINLSAAGSSNYTLDIDKIVLSGTELLSNNAIGAGTNLKKPISNLGPRSLYILEY